MSAEVITSTEALEALTERVKASDRVGLCLEQNNEHAYRPRVCVLQLTLGQAPVLVDMLTLWPQRPAIERLIEALCRPGLAVVVHGGEHHAAALRRDFGVRIAGLWDSQQAAVLLGLAKTGYRSLAEAGGVRLPPPLESIDWARRPLSEEAMTRAAADVRLLLSIANELKRLLNEADLVAEHALHSADVALSQPEPRFRPDGFWSIKGAARLDLVGQHVLCALYQWRDQLAREFDVPPRRVMTNAQLLALSRDPPQNQEALSIMRFHSRLLHSDRQQLWHVVDNARREQIELPPRRVRAPDSRPAKAVLEGLKAWRRQEAERRGVGLQAILPKKSMRYLARHRPGELALVPLLGDRRIERYGEELRAIVERVDAR